MEPNVIITYRKTQLRDIAITELAPGPYQPRQQFSKEGLETLAQTIRQVGILEPLVVRPGPTAGHYEIVAGERRWRAASLVGLSTVPCLVSTYSDEQSAQIALIENTCREALNPIAEAQAMQRLIQEFKYTHEELAAILGMNRVHVTHHLRLLKLDARIQVWLAQGALSEGQGKMLAGLPLDQQYRLAYQSLQQGWSTRLLDKAIKALNTQKPAIEPTPARQQLDQVEQQLTEQLSSPVKISLTRQQSGYVRLAFADLQQLQALLVKLGYRE